MSNDSIEQKKKKIRDLLEKGRKNRTLTYKEIMDTLEEVDVYKRQL